MSTIKNSLSISINWDELMKEGLAMSLKEIPEVGEILSGLLKAFWPEDNEKDDIFQKLIPAVTDLINEAILKEKMNEVKNLIQTYRNNMSMYYSVSNESEKGNYLSNLVTLGLEIFNEMTYNPDSPEDSMHCIPLSATFLPLHLGVLRERMLHGEKLYGKYDSAWETQLKGQATAYITYLKKYYPQLKTYIANQVQWHPVTDGGVTYGKVKIVKNGATVKSNNWQYFGGDDNDYFAPAVEDLKECYQQNWAKKMTDILSPFYVVDCYSNPDSTPTQPIELLTNFEIGPLNTINFEFGNPSLDGTNIISKYSNIGWSNDKQGVVKEIKGYTGDTIDGLQFIYNNKPGTVVAQTSGKTPQIIQIPEGKEFCGMLMNWTDYQMVSAKFYDRDYKTPLGTIKGNHEGNYNFGVGTPQYYDLKGVQMRAGFDASNGINAIKIAFVFNAERVKNIIKSSIMK